MKMRYFFIAIVVVIFILTSTATATSPYGKIDVYFNDKMLPGKEIAKPLLKIGEPFNIKINMTVFKEYEVSGKLTELGNGYFEVIDGPSKMNHDSSIILKTNESHIFEWTVKPTEEWAGGSLPINFHYSFLEKGNPEPVVNSEFTVAYCTISNEHYKAEVPTPQEPQVSKTEPSSTSVATPAFTLVGAISVLALAFALFRR